MRDCSISWRHDTGSGVHDFALGIYSGPCTQAAIKCATHDWTLSPELLRAEPLPPLGRLPMTSNPPLLLGR